MRIVAAAIRTKTKVHVGPSHSLICIRLGDYEMADDEFEPGFVDDEDKFVTYSQANDIGIGTSDDLEHIL